MCALCVRLVCAPCVCALCVQLVCATSVCALCVRLVCATSVCDCLPPLPLLPPPALAAPRSHLPIQSYSAPCTDRASPYVPGSSPVSPAPQSSAVPAGREWDESGTRVGREWRDESGGTRVAGREWREWRELSSREWRELSRREALSERACCAHAVGAHSCACGSL